MQQKIVIGLILTLVIVIFIPYYGLTEPGRQQAARERLTSEAVARGAAIYALHCASCHGASGEGLVGPALKNSPLDKPTMVKTISRGIPETLMPAFADTEGGPLKANQIDDLVTFIKNLGLSSAAPAPPTTTPPATPSPTPTPMPAPTSTPSPVNAGELFSAKCALCHGATRAGITGLGPALNPTSLAAVGINEVRGTITDGNLAKGMPPFKSILTSEEIDALAQFVKNVSP